MRLLELELERYGHFTGRTLVFRRDACLHVVYGANEAGKTSSLNAVGDLLFGFGERTRYDFLHVMNKLSVGALIEAKDGRRLSFKRHKGRKNTLLAADGTVLPDNTLASYIGAITRTVFSNSFGLNKDTLRAGAKEMVDSGGDAGTSLFVAASGLSGLTGLKKRLEDEASGIFTPNRSQNRIFYQCLDRYTAAASQIKDLELRANALRDRRGRISDLSEALDSVQKELRDLIQRREYLARQRDLTPLLREIAADEILLKNFELFPAIESSRVSQLRGVLTKINAAEMEIGRLTLEEAHAVKTVEGLIVDDDLIAQGSTITSLFTEAGNYSTLKSQLPRVSSEAAGFVKNLNDLRYRLGLPDNTNLLTSLPNDLLVTRAKGQITVGRSLAASLQGKAESLRKERGICEGMLKEQDGQDSSSDPKPIRDQLNRLMPILASLKDIQRLDRSTSREAEQIEEKAAQLTPPISDLDAIAQLSLPSAEVIEDFADSSDEMQKELSTLASTLKECERTLPSLQYRANELAEGHLDATPEKIASTRATRSEQWQPLRSVLLGEAQMSSFGTFTKQVVEFEKTVETSDRLADDALTNADRIASHVAAQKRLTEEQEKREFTLIALGKTEQQIAETENTWQAPWSQFAFKATAPRRMGAWRTQVEILLERRTDHLSKLGELASLRESVLKVRPNLNGLAIQLRISEAEMLPTELLVSAVEKEIELRAEWWRKAQDRLTRIANTKERIEDFEEQFNALRTDERKWKSTWADILAGMHLALETSVEEAGTALDLWQQVPGTQNEYEDRAKRVEGMNRDMARFDLKVSGVLTDLNQPNSGLGPDVAIKALADRLKAAQQIETKAQVAQARLSELCLQFELAKGSLSRAQGEFEVLSLGLPSAQDRLALVTHLEERQVILTRLNQKRQTLVPLSRGESEIGLRETLESFNEDTAVAEIQELTGKEERKREVEKQTYSDLRTAKGELLNLESGVGAEVAVQLRRNAETQMIEKARQWALKRTSYIILLHAIEKHRSEQEQPLLKRAGELFSLLTAGSFIGIQQGFDSNDVPELLGQRNPDVTLDIEGMSEGTRDQLYLAIRLAYLEEYAQKAEPVPFIGDDLLTNFDDGRTKRGLAALASTGRSIQPILFTHHMGVVEAARAELGQRVDVIML